MSIDQNSKSRFFIIYSIIFVTGFTFLVYEVSWNRMLSLVLGATVSASTIVLATFMAGFSLGAYFLGKIVNVSLKPGRLLSFLLLGIGIFGLITYYLLSNFLPSLYQSFGNKEISIQTTELFVYSISILLLLIQTFLMGGMIPVVSKIVIQKKETISSGIGKIYALDTLGSAVGGLLTGFILMGSLGQQNTIFVAVVINIIIGLYLLFSKSFSHELDSADIAEESTKHSSKKSRVKETENSALNRKMALPATFVLDFQSWLFR